MFSNDNDSPRHDRLRFRFLFGVVEADASGLVAIGAAFMVIVLFAAGRFWGLW